MIDLITTVRSLSWMRKVHRPTETNHTPIQLLETRTADGAVAIPAPHGLCVRNGVACVHLGMLRGKPAEPSADMVAWAARTFFATEGLQPLRTIPREEFLKWVQAAPKPQVIICEHCSGTGMEPGATVEDDMIPVCSVCNGDWKYTDESAAFVEVGPVKVVLAYLEPFVRYLGGMNVSVGIAPISGNGGSYLHLRQLTASTKDGDWRIVMATTPTEGEVK